MQAALTFGTILVMLAGGVLIIKNELSIGDCAQHFFCMSIYSWSQCSDLPFSQKCISGLTGFYRFQEVMRIEPDIVDAQDTVDDWTIKGEVVFRAFPFAYTEKNNYFGSEFKNSAGETVAFVGETGVGKTTVANMLWGFMNRSGERLLSMVLISGKSVKNLFAWKHRRQHLGMCFYSLTLFTII